MKKIGIIGAGISGLYLANLLEKEKDLDYKIFEKRSKLNLAEGYGIQLSVNSIKLLNKIGFKNISASDVFFPTKVNFFNSNKNAPLPAEGSIIISASLIEIYFFMLFKHSITILFLV